MVTLKKALHAIATFLLFFICYYAVNYIMNGKVNVLSAIIFALITTPTLIIANKIFGRKNQQ